MSLSRSRLARIGSACWLLWLASGSATGQMVDPATLDEIVTAEMERQRVPGVALAVVQEGRVVAAKGYGLANVEHRVPVTSETLFQSGSVGKQFTAAAVMALVEEGRVGLEDSITGYFPEAPESWRSITVRHLLTHTSGIADYELGTEALRRDWSEEDFARLAYELPLEFPAGSRWNYSNSGYVLLGIIVGKAAGRFWGDVLAERFFVPLGMKTARVISEADVVPNRAAGYRLVDGELKNQEWVSPTLNTWADGSLYLSLEDLIAWDRALRERAVLEPESWAEILASVRLASGKTYPYGFGWRFEEIAGQRVERHGGAWQGFQTHLARYRGDDLTVVVLTNLAEAEPERFVVAVAGAFNPDLAPGEPSPIPDREPEVTARLRTLLAAAAEGRLRREEFAYVRAGFFPATALEYADLLRGLGGPRRVELFERSELGDDRVYDYGVTYPDTTLRVRLGLAPDGRISLLEIREN